MYTANWVDFIHTGILIVATIFSFLAFRESVKSGGKLSPFILNTLFSKMVLRNEIIYWAKSKYGGYYVFMFIKTNFISVTRNQMKTLFLETIQKHHQCQYDSLSNQRHSKCLTNYDY